MSWDTLLEIPPNQLKQARLQLHHAVQIPAIIARSYIGKHDDDIHANLGWNTTHKALMSKPISSPDSTLQIGIQLETLNIIIVSGEEIFSFSLNGHSWEEGLNWATETLQTKRLAADKLDKEQPYSNDLPDFPTASGSMFALDHTQAFTAIASFFSNSDFLIKEILSPISEASDIRCWPHHFDIASLISYEGGKSIGIGLSPGDGSSTLPYYYINMWPYPDLGQTKLPELKAGGKWHTEGWTGTVLTADEIWGADAQGKKVDSFIREAFTHAKSLIR